jgi:hypothetical protein
MRVAALAKSKSKDIKTWKNINSFAGVILHTTTWWEAMLGSREKGLILENLSLCSLLASHSPTKKGKKWDLGGEVKWHQKQR